MLRSMLVLGLMTFAGFSNPGAGTKPAICSCCGDLCTCKACACEAKKSEKSKSCSCCGETCECTVCACS